jgi:hypothetical protein
LLNRRRAVATGGAAALAGLARTGHQTALASVRTGGGIAGGGWIQFDGGEAQFSVFGSRFNDDEQDEPILVGSFIWREASGRTLTSTFIRAYGPDPEVETARIMTGDVMNSETTGAHAFSIRLNDLGGPGEGLDTFELMVGPLTPADAAVASPTAENAILSVSGTITVGDVQLVTFDFGEA